MNGAQRAVSEALRKARKRIKVNDLYSRRRAAGEAQGGKCAICNAHQSTLKRSLHADHDHATGKLRGLLCSSCNVGVGHLRDNARLLLNAARYLLDHQA